MPDHGVVTIPPSTVFSASNLNDRTRFWAPIISCAGRDHIQATPTGPPETVGHGIVSKLVQRRPESARAAWGLQSGGEVGPFVAAYMAKHAEFKKKKQKMEFCCSKQPGESNVTSTAIVQQAGIADVTGLAFSSKRSRPPLRGQRSTFFSFLALPLTQCEGAAGGRALALPQTLYFEKPRIALRPPAA